VCDPDLALDDLVELCERLIAREPSARPSPAEILEICSARTNARASFGLSRTPPPLFVGREAELSELRAALREARDGHWVMQLVSGPSGVGKSALLDAFAAEIDGASLVLRGTCRERELIPYKVFDAVVDSLSKHLARLPPAEIAQLVPKHVSSLVRLLPALGRVAAIERASREQHPPTDVRELRNQAFAALKELLLRLARRAPVVIAVDDLQWGDVDSVRMLSFLMIEPGVPALLFVGAYRNDDITVTGFLPELLGWLPTGAPAVRPRELRPLMDGEALELSRALLRDAGVSEVDQLALDVATEAAGLPVFINELVEHVRLHGPSGRLYGGAVTLERALLERVSALPADAQALLRVLSIAAGPIDRGVALDAAGLPDRSALMVLRSMRLVRTCGGSAHGALELYHDRIREVVASSIAVEEARVLHARIAAAMERHGVTDPEKLVVHHLRSGDVRRAAESACLAADAATRQLAFHRASDLLSLAIEHMSPEEARARDLHRQLGDVLASAGRSAFAADAYLRAAEQHDGEAASALRRSAMQHYVRSGRLAEGLSLARELFRDAGLTLPRSAVGVAGTYVWHRARLRARHFVIRERPVGEFDRGRLERLDLLGGLYPELSVIDMLRGAALQTQYLREALDVGEPERALQALVWETYNLAALGGAKRWRRARDTLLLARTAASLVDSPHARAMVDLAEASYHLWRGRSFGAALEVSARAEAGFAAVGTVTAWERGIATFVHCTSLEYAGPLASLASRGVETMREARERDDWFIGTLMLLSVTCAQIFRGEPLAALDLLASYESRLGAGYNAFHYLRVVRTAESYLALDRTADALAVWSTHWPAFRRSNLYRSTFVRETAHYLRARYALIEYLRTRRPALLDLVRSELARLERATAIYAITSRTFRAALHADAGDRRSAIVQAETMVSELQAVGAPLTTLYGEIALAELRQDGETSCAKLAELERNGARDPARWAWMNLPTRARPS
jgi:hypothetical protein